MRIRTWWLFPLLLLIVAFAGITWFRADLLAWFADRSPVVQPVQTTQDNTTSTIVYKVTTADWVNFALPPNPDSVRIISNGCLSPRMQSQHSDREWHYQIRYRILNNRRVIDEGSYHFRSQVPEGFLEHTSAEAGTVEKPSMVRQLFFQDSDHHLCSGRQMILGLDTGDDIPTTLQLKLMNHDEGLDYCVARCMCDNIVPDHQLQRRWNRLSPEQREKLTDGTVYPLHLLSDVEKQNLVRHQWMPLAPSGIEGRHYDRRRMFRFSDFVPQNPSVTKSNSMQEGTRVAFKVPASPGTLRVTVDTKQQSYDRPTDPQPLVIHSHPDQSAPMTSHTFLTDGQNETFAIQTDGGILNVESEIPLDVAAQWFSADNEISLPLAAAETRFQAYIAQKGTPIRYSIVRNNRSAAPIRLSLRQILFAQTQESTRVQWQTVDESENVVATGDIFVPSQICSGSRLRHDVFPPRLSKPVRVFIPLHNNATTLILTSDSPTAIAAATRSNQLPAIRKITDQIQPSLAEDESRTWFLLRPLNATALSYQQQVATVIVQPESESTIKPDKDDFVWKSFQPAGHWSARHLLIPQPNADDFRPQAAAVSYFELSPSIDTDVEFLTDNAELCFWQNADLANPITLTIDGKTVLSETLLVPSGRLSFAVPPADTKPHVVRIECQTPVMVALNRVLPIDQQSFWRRRLATRFDQQQLEFTYHKSHDGPQTLSLKLFRSADTNSESELRVRLARISPATSDNSESFQELRPPSGDFQAFKDWTIPETRFVIDHVEHKGVVSLSHTKESLEQCGTCFVKLGEDLAAGHYRIQVARIKGDATYLTCTTLENPPVTFSETRRIRMTNQTENGLFFIADAADDAGF